MCVVVWESAKNRHINLEAATILKPYMTYELNDPDHGNYEMFWRLCGWSLTQTSHLNVASGEVKWSLHFSCMSVTFRSGSDWLLKLFVVFLLLLEVAFCGVIGHSDLLGGPVSSGNAKIANQINVVVPKVNLYWATAPSTAAITHNEAKKLKYNRQQI